MRTSDVFSSGKGLKAEDLPRPVKVTIESVESKTFNDSPKLILHFVGKEKTLICNRTNALRIAEATGSDETDDWEGWTITLYVAKVDFQGKRVPAIRVDDRPGTTTPPARLQRRTAAPAVEDRGVEEPPDVDEDDIPF